MNQITLTPAKTLTLGVICYGLLLVMLATIFAALEWLNLVTFSCLVVILGAGYYFGTFTIPIVHTGVLTVFGKRSEDMAYSEGLHWKPPFVGYEDVDLSEQSTIVKDLEFVVGHEITLPNGMKVPDLAEFLESLTVYWNAEDPFNFLKIGKEQVMVSLKHEMIAALREIGTRYTPTEYLSVKREDVQREVLKIFKNKLGGDNDILDRWGIVVHNVSIPRVQLKSEKLKTAFEERLKEERERSAEELATEHAANMIDMIATKIGCSVQEAALIYQRLAGLLPAREFVITSSGVGDVTRAAVAGAQILSEKGGK